MCRCSGRPVVMGVVVVMLPLVARCVLICSLKRPPSGMRMRMRMRMRRVRVAKSVPIIAGVVIFPVVLCWGFVLETSAQQIGVCVCASVYVCM